MSINVKFNDNSVCFADGQQWYFDNYFSDCVNFSDFQLNTIKQGDYISKSELDTVDKYNRAVEVFGLFGYVFKVGAISDYEEFSKEDSLGCFDDGLWQTNVGHYENQRKLTYNQLMAIGELKRLMDNRETVCGKPKSEFVEAIKRVNELESSNDGKSLQAYEVLKSLDYEFDSEKGRWYRKEWV